jgi:hypothetical protein
MIEGMFAPAELTVLTRRRELLAAGSLAALIGGLMLAIGPPPGDAPAHLYRTLLVREGALVWDNYWYAGTYPLGSYSILYYLPAAVVGNLPLVFAATIATALLFSSIALREWGPAARWPSRAFGALAAAPLFTGLYAYSLGLAATLGVLWAVQHRRTWLAVILAGLTVGFSPLAFVFLCLILSAVVISRRRFSRRELVLAAGLTVVAAVQFGVLWAFSTPTGAYPFHWINLVGVVGVSFLGILLARQAQGAAFLVTFYLLWATGSVILFFISTPVGDNWARLSAFVFPVMLLTAALASFRPRRLVGVALGVALAFNVTPYMLLIPYRLDTRPATAAFWAPALGFLRQHLAPGFRVEVVPTAAHWEAYWVPRAGFPLARGWYRQIDVADNPVLYKPTLNLVPFLRWLHSNAVEYVMLARTRLDWVEAREEAHILSAPASRLQIAFRSQNWTIYRVPHPTPLLTGPGKPVVTFFGHTAIRGTVTSPGRYLLRAHYSPYWRVKGGGCVSPGPGKMTWLKLDHIGRFALAVPATPGALIDSLSDQPRC